MRFCCALFLLGLAGCEPQPQNSADPPQNTIALGSGGTTKADVENPGTLASSREEGESFILLDRSFWIAHPNLPKGVGTPAGDEGLIGNYAASARACERLTPIESLRLKQDGARLMIGSNKVRFVVNEVCPVVQREARGRTRVLTLQCSDRQQQEPMSITPDEADRIKVTLRDWQSRPFVRCAP